MTRTGITIRHANTAIDLAPEEQITFGRSTADTDAPSTRHLGLTADAALHAHAGTVVAGDGGWTIINTGRWLRLRLQEIDGPGSAEVAPGRSLLVPWPRSRLEIATGTEVVGFVVEAELDASFTPSAVAPLTAGETVGGLGLDRDAGYFRALVALCEPQLREPGCARVATAAEIARVLNRLETEPERVTAKAVERRLAHVRRRIGVGGRDPDGISAAGLEQRDAAERLVNIALRTGTVTRADLDLLIPPYLDPP